MKLSGILQSVLEHDQINDRNKWGVYEYFSGFSGARKVYINTSPEPGRSFEILPKPLRRRRGSR